LQDEWAICERCINGGIVVERDTILCRITLCLATPEGTVGREPFCLTAVLSSAFVYSTMLHTLLYSTVQWSY
jgi:hypothetical protein